MSVMFTSRMTHSTLTSTNEDPMTCTHTRREKFDSQRCFDCGTLVWCGHIDPTGQDRECGCQDEDDEPAPGIMRCVICGCPEGGLYPAACCSDPDNIEED